VTLRRGEDIAERRKSRRYRAVDNSEVEIGGVTVIGHVNEPERRSTLEHQAPSVSGHRVMKLGDDMAQDVVTLHDRRLDLILLGSAGDRVASKHA
jgi:hypothetical protein